MTDERDTTGQPPETSNRDAVGADRTAVADPRSADEIDQELASQERRATSAGATVVDREIDTDPAGRRTDERPDVAPAAPDDGTEGRADARSQASSAGYSLVKLRELYGVLDPVERGRLEARVGEVHEARPRDRDNLVAEAYACYLASEDALRRGDGNMAGSYANRERMRLEEAMRLTDRTSFEQPPPNRAPHEEAELAAQRGQARQEARSMALNERREAMAGEVAERSGDEGGEMLREGVPDTEGNRDLQEPFPSSETQAEEAEQSDDAQPAEETYDEEDDTNA